MNLIAQAVLGMQATLNRVAGSEITYHQAGKPAQKLCATGVARDYEVMDADGLVTIKRGRDFIVIRSELWNEPRTGDQITERIGNRVTEYRVFALGDKPCFEERDNDGQTIAIHTAETG